MKKHSIALIVIFFLSIVTTTTQSQPLVVDFGAYGFPNGASTVQFNAGTNYQFKNLCTNLCEYTDFNWFVNEPVITANISGTIYQWIDCGNPNAIIPGDTSNCTSFITTQVPTSEFNNSFVVYPNPASSVGTDSAQISKRLKE